MVNEHKYSNVKPENLKIILVPVLVDVFYIKSTSE